MTMKLATLLLVILAITPDSVQSIPWLTKKNTVLPPPCCKTPSQPVTVTYSCNPCKTVTTTTTPPPPPQVYTPSPCLPPTCYTDKVKQKEELEKIYKEASQTMVKYTDTATGPVVYIAQSVSYSADLIPSMFSAGGGFLGKAVAKPIQFFNRIGFSLLSSAISQVVTIPISLGTSVRASSVLIQPYLRWLGLTSLPTGCCNPPTPSPSAYEQIGLRPIGILSGPITLALGSALNIGGSTFRLIGTMTKAGGEAVENSGLYLKNIGAFKVADGFASVASALEKIGKGEETICIDDGEHLSFYTNVTKTDSYSTTPYATTPYATTPYATTPYPTTPYVTTYAPGTTPYTTVTSQSYTTTVAPTIPPYIDQYGTTIPPSSKLDKLVEPDTPADDYE